jgi:hypothetical protein
MIAKLNQPTLELGFMALRLPLLSMFASQVFFGRGSFPDVDVLPARSQPVTSSQISPKPA